MLRILLDVILPVALVASIGCLWGLAKRRSDTLSFSMAATYVGSPCLVIEALGTPA